MAATLIFSSTTSLCLPSSLSVSAPCPAISATLLLKVQTRSVKPGVFNGLKSQAPFPLKQRSCVIVKASSEIDGTGPDNATPPPDAKEEAIPVENLPLESKQQLIQEQRLKMKLAKKIRLRRKRLVRKRHLRKKGRWPPSKMKKNKNV